MDPVHFYQTDGGYSFNESYEDYNMTHELFITEIGSSIANYGIFLTIWTILINMLICLLCLAVPDTRYGTFYLQILNYSLTNLSLCVFVIPFAVYYDLNTWELGEDFCAIWIICDVLLPYVSMLVLLVMHLDRLLYFVSYRAYICAFQTRCAHVLLLLPWLLGIIVVVPLWKQGIVHHSKVPGECIISVDLETAVATPVLTFFIPLIFTILMTLTVLVNNVKEEERPDFDTTNGYTLKSMQESCDPESALEPTPDREQYGSASNIISMFLVNFFFCAMWFPYQCINVVLSLCNFQSCLPSIEMRQVFTWIATSSAGVTPLFWLVDSQLRDNFRKLFCRCKKKEEKTTTPAEQCDTFI